METYQPDSFGLRTEERTSFQRHSPTHQPNLDSITKPPRASRDVDVLLKANEVLQRSIKFNNTTSTGDILNNNAKSQVLAPVSVSNYENTTLNNTKTYDVLNRANEILKKSANYSKEIGVSSSSKNSPLKYYSSSNQYGGVGKTGSGYYPEKRTYGESYTGYGSSVEKGNNPRDILSKIDLALQNSSQIPSDGNYYSGEARNNSLKLGSLIRNEVRNSQYLKKSHNDFNTIDYRNNSQYETPQKSYAYNTTQETLKYQPSNYVAAPSAYKIQGIENITTQIPPEINRAYVEALRRSQEVMLKNEEELNKIGYRSSPVGEKNLRSSYVMERQTATSQYENESYSPSIDRDIPPPGIHIQAQPAIKPKFVEEYLDDGTVYKGEKIRTAKHGRGEFIQVDGSKYEGEWENDKKTGFGVQKSANGRIIYDGEWKEDLYHGNGILVNESATPLSYFDYRDFDHLENNWVKYEGEFLNGKMNGLGTLTLFNNERYVGKFKYDKVHGVGVFHRNNGETISAEWENNKLIRIA